MSEWRSSKLLVEGLEGERGEDRVSSMLSVGESLVLELVDTESKLGLVMVFGSAKRASIQKLDDIVLLGVMMAAAVAEMI